MELPALHTWLGDNATENAFKIIVLPYTRQRNCGNHWPSVVSWCKVVPCKLLQGSQQSGHNPLDSHSLHVCSLGGAQRCPEMKIFEVHAYPYVVSNGGDHVSFTNGVISELR